MNPIEDDNKPFKSWKLRLIQSLGLQKYILNKFVFKPPQTSYVFEQHPTTSKLSFYPIYMNKKIFSIHQSGLSFKPYILTTNNITPGTMVSIIYVTRPPNIRCNNAEYFKPTPAKRRNSTLQDRMIYQCKQRAKSMQTSLQTSMIRKENDTFKPRLLVVYSHGNASDLGDVYYFAERIVFEYNVDFLAYDYSGYGLSLGTHEVNELQTYKDLQYVLSFCIDKLNYQLPQIVLWGFSLGSGPTIEIASRFSGLGGVILQSPLASLVLWLEKDRSTIEHHEEDVYSNINKIQSVKSKILIMHGENDSIIPYRHSQMLYDKYRQANPHLRNNISFVRVSNRDHNNLQDLIERADEELGQQIFRFLKHVDVQRATLVVNSDWPPQEIAKISTKIEIVLRETMLLRLMSDEYEVTGMERKQIEMQNKLLISSHDQVLKKQRSSITPIEDLQIKPRRPIIQDYRSIIRTKQISQIKSNQMSIKQKSEFFQINCLC